MSLTLKFTGVKQIAFPYVGSPNLIRWRPEWVRKADSSWIKGNSFFLVSLSWDINIILPLNWTEIWTCDLWTRITPLALLVLRHGLELKSSALLGLQQILKLVSLRNCMNRLLIVNSLYKIICIYRCMYIYTYIYAYIHTYAHICIWIILFSEEPWLKHLWKILDLEFHLAASLWD